jgi:hypothetical protein
LRPELRLRPGLPLWSGRFGRLRLRPGLHLRRGLPLRSGRAVRPGMPLRRSAFPGGLTREAKFDGLRPAQPAERPNGEDGSIRLRTHG